MYDRGRLRGDAHLHLGSGGPRVIYSQPPQSLAVPGISACSSQGGWRNLNELLQTPFLEAFGVEE